jgi:transcriptional regulator with XRE-family HTH domain
VTRAQEGRATGSAPARATTRSSRAGAARFADPIDEGQLDVVCFDTATPQLISDFACCARSDVLGDRGQPSKVSRWERGVTTPSLSRLRRIAEVTETTLSDLLRAPDAMSAHAAELAALREEPAETRQLMDRIARAVDGARFATGAMCCFQYFGL